MQLRDDSAYVEPPAHACTAQPLDYCSAVAGRRPGAARSAAAAAASAMPTRSTCWTWVPTWRTPPTGRRGCARCWACARSTTAASDHSLTTGFQGIAAQTLLQPKGSVILGPFCEDRVLFQRRARLSFGRCARRLRHRADRRRAGCGRGKTPLLAPTQGDGVRHPQRPRFRSCRRSWPCSSRTSIRSWRYDADPGQDAASAPSRRRGVEFSAQYRPLPWIEFNTDLACRRARYRGDLAAFGLDGPWIANAPKFIGSFGVLVNNLGPWFGGLQWRKLGPYPISDGDRVSRRTAATASSIWTWATSSTPS